MARKLPGFNESGREQLPGLSRPLESVPRGRSCVPRVGETHRRVAGVGIGRVTPPGPPPPGPILWGLRRLRRLRPQPRFDEKCHNTQTAVRRVFRSAFTGCDFRSRHSPQQLSPKPGNYRLRLTDQLTSVPSTV